MAPARAAGAAPADDSESKANDAASSSSTSAAATATTTTALTDSPAPTARPRRTHAKRSCLECRTKKARCELPNIHVASSRDPVSAEDRCHRCSVLGVDCIVWDGDRKRKPRLPPVERASDAAPQGEGEASTSSRHAVATQAAKKRRIEGSQRDSADSPTGGGTSRSTRAEALATILRQPASTSSTPGPGSARSSSAESITDTFFDPFPDREAPRSGTTGERKGSKGELRNDGTSNIETDATASTSGALPADAPVPSDTNAAASGTRIQTQLGGSSKQAVAGSKLRSVWNPFGILLSHATAQQGFVAGLLARVELPKHCVPTLDIVDLIDEDLCILLEPSLDPYLPWHPHLPSLRSVYIDHRSRATRSSSLLLATLALLAARYREPLSNDIPRRLSYAIDRLGEETLLSVPKSPQAATALELLVAHEPSLIGTAAAGDTAEAQASRGTELAGMKLVATALTICQDTGVDGALRRLSLLLEQPELDAIQRREIEALMPQASLWLSLRLWEGYQTLLKTRVRPLTDLDEVSRMADTLIGRYGNGEAVVGRSRPDAKSGAPRPGVDERHENGEMDRAAGRTLLAFRMQSMAGFHRAVGAIERILPQRKAPRNAAAATDEPRSTTESALRPERPVEPELHDTAALSGKELNEIRGKIADECLGAYGNRIVIENKRHIAMAAFAVEGRGILTEMWVNMEALSLCSILGLLSNLAIQGGQLHFAISSKTFIRSYTSSPGMREHLGRIGNQYLEVTKRVVSSFDLFDRTLTTMTQPFQFADATRPGTIEPTGAPLLLTSALVVDACKTFVESVATVLHVFASFMSAAETYCLYMRQASRRLEEMDLNRLVATRGDGATSMTVTQTAARYVTSMMQLLEKWHLTTIIHRVEPINPFGPGWGPDANRIRPPEGGKTNGREGEQSADRQQCAGQPDDRGAAQGFASAEAATARAQSVSQPRPSRSPMGPPWDDARATPRRPAARSDQPSFFADMHQAPAGPHVDFAAGHLTSGFANPLVPYSPTDPSASSTHRSSFADGRTPSTSALTGMGYAGAPADGRTSASSGEADLTPGSSLDLWPMDGQDPGNFDDWAFGMDGASMLPPDLAWSVQSHYHHHHQQQQQQQPGSGSAMMASTGDGGGGGGGRGGAAMGPTSAFDALFESLFPMGGGVAANFAPNGNNGPRGNGGGAL